MYVKKLTLQIAVLYSSGGMEPKNRTLTLASAPELLKSEMKDSRDLNSLSRIDAGKTST